MFRIDSKRDAFWSAFLFIKSGNASNSFSPFNSLQLIFLKKAMSPSRLIATTIITIGVVLCIFMFFEIEYILQVPQRLFTKQDSTAIEQQQKVVAFTTGGEKKLAKCIASAPGFTQSESCYSEFKHDILMAFLDNMEKLSEDESSKFQALDHYSPHQILIPTHECDFLKLQRMGDHAYGTKPGDQHPDGPKWMCPEYLDVNDGECVIFSVGSNGDFQFEESMRKFVGDRCKIYTFDCTGAWSNPATHFLPWCIADSNHEGDDGKIYKTFSEIMGLLGVKKVSVLKIDVEG